MKSWAYLGCQSYQNSVRSSLHSQATAPWHFYLKTSQLWPEHFQCATLVLQFPFFLIIDCCCLLEMSK